MSTLKTFKILAVDDEANCLEVLEQKLHQLGIPPANICTCSNPFNVVHLISAFQPDLLLISAMMRKITGSQLLEMLPQCNFSVVFIAADDKHALSAIKASALDYLMKPLSETDLSVALNRFISSQQRTNTSTNQIWSEVNINGAPRINNKIALPTMEDITIFPLEEISYFESNDNLSYLHLTNKERIAINLRLINLENKLSGQSFYRIHKRFLVNTAKVKRITRKNGNLVVLENGASIALSRYRRKAFLDLLNNNI